MSFLDTGIKILLWGGFVFWGIFSYASLLWTERKPTEIRNIAGAMIVSLLLTFKILLIGTIVLVLIYLIISF